MFIENVLHTHYLRKFSNHLKLSKVLLCGVTISGHITVDMVSVRLLRKEDT